jgi:integrase
VKCAMGDMVKMAVAEGYITTNIAEGLKTPRTARLSDRSLLRCITLPEYLQAWNALEERERLAFDLVTFCGLRESEAYVLKINDFFRHGAIRVQRSWFKGSVSPTKTNKVRNVAIEDEIFERLMAWIAGLPERNGEGWVFPSEGIVTPVLPDNVIRRWIRPRLEPLNLGWVTFAVLRRSHSTLHKEKGTDPKVIADQQGHGLGVDMAEYVESSLAVKRAAVSALWADFKALRSEVAIS